VAANGGTFLLDEVGEMSLPMQAKLLRVIQEREVTRVGGDAPVPVDVRLISATNRDLIERIREGAFREDLYYRLNVIHLTLPPLRERREDIPLLADHFLGQFAEKHGKAVKGFSPEAMDQLIRAPWPGNVRELANAVERAVVLARGGYIDDLDPIAARLGPGNHPTADDPPADHGSLEAVEKATILKTLAATGGNKSEAARRLGITRKTLHAKLKKYEMTP